MFDPIFEELRARMPIDPARWQEFVGRYHRIEVPAKTTLLTEGQVSKKAYLVESGCLRVWFNHKGKDLTYRFVFENDAVASAESFRKNVPSLFSIESIEPCVLHWIHKKDLDEILLEANESREFREAYLDMLFERQFHYMNKFLSLIRDTPTERYQTLVRESPHILQRVPQHYIASYLGITPVSLSRIRAKLRC